MDQDQAAAASSPAVEIRRFADSFSVSMIQTRRSSCSLPNIGPGYGFERELSEHLFREHVASRGNCGDERQLSQFPPRCQRV